MIRKLLSATALASVALAQSISIAVQKEVAAGSAFVVQIARPTPPTGNQDVGLVIAGLPCLAGCPEGLGNHVLYNGPFNPQSTNSAGNEHQNFRLTAPNSFDGIMQLSVAHLYLQESNNIYSVEQEIVKTTVNITGSSG